MTTRRSFSRQRRLWFRRWRATPLFGAEAAGLALPAQGGARRELKLGTVTYNIAKDWDVPTLIANLTEAKIGAVELRTTHAHGVEPTLAPAARADVRKRFADSAVRIGGLGTICEYHAADPAVVRKNIEETRAWLRAGARSRMPERQGAAERPARRRAGGADARADRQGAGGLRPHRAGSRRAAAARGARPRHRARCRGFEKILEYSPATIRRSGCAGTPIRRTCSTAASTKNFALVKERIGQVHMRDLYVEEYPWQRLVQLLQGIDFQGYCFAELGQPSTDGVRVLKYFRGMFRQLQGIVDPPRSA